MSNQKSFFSIILVLSFSIGVSAQMGTQTQMEDVPSLADTNESFFSKKQKIDAEGVELYQSNLEMKKYKKIGMGISLGGSGGVVALNGELNLNPQDALVVGLGTGPNYGTFNLLWKKNYQAEYLSPFFKVGYSKWFNSSKGSLVSDNSGVLKQIYSTKDIVEGRFDADFAVASIGAEYNQLEGELSGVNFYGELVLLTEVKKTVMVPSGAVGIIYFY